MLEVIGLQKRLGPNLALDDFNLEAQLGERVVITGPNGAGKSTLLQIVAGILIPDRGSVLWNGELLHHRRSVMRLKIGYVPEAADPPGHLTVAELLYFVAATKECEALTMAELAELQVEELLGERIGELSLGQRRRACLAAALTGQPALLILDEPTNGLDPESIRGLQNTLKTATPERLLLCATHDLDFADEIQTRRVALTAPGGT